jgi:hypothetical protein
MYIFRHVNIIFMYAYVFIYLYIYIDKYMYIFVHICIYIMYRRCIGEGTKIIDISCQDDEDEFYARYDIWLCNMPM